MSEAARPPNGENHPPDMAELQVEQPGGFSLVWLIPLVALLIGAWLAYKTFSEQGPTVTITFEDAGGLEEGKTKVKFKDVEVGLVETVHLSEDLSKVFVTAKLDKTIASHLGEDTRFWVVKPQLGLGGISGLDTLVAGRYIAVEFGASKKLGRQFVGLERAPKISADTPGRHFMLLAESAGSLSEGTPVYFRDIKAGRVAEVNLTDDKQGVLADVFLDAPFDQLVHDNTKFWQTSGIDASMGADGIKVKMGSLLSLLGGGITFETPNLNEGKSAPSEAGAHFMLYKDFASIAEGDHKLKEHFVMYFDDSVRGLARGAPVELRGIRIGKVTDVWFEFHKDTQKIRIPVYIEIEPDRIMPDADLQAYLQSMAAVRAAGRRPIMEKMVASGLRGRLKTGSFLTGQLYVDLDFYADAAPKTVGYNGPFPELPTLPSVTDELQNSVTEILAKLKRLPLDKIGDELLATSQGANRLVNSQDLKDSMRSLNLALQDVHQLSQTADRELVKLTAGLEKSLAAAVKILEQLEPGSPIVVDVRNAMEELSASARSIRTLTDYLERHPEALLNGKGGAKK
ncbi:MAG: intermembrane transport protein PqiB [Candidatus Methylumidiphilus sp.]